MSTVEFDVPFSSGQKTRVVIGPVALLPELCRAAGLSGKSALLCDSRLLELQHAALRPLVPAFGELLARPVSESRKTLAEVEAMCEALLSRGLGRDGFVVAVGGGVFTDLAGLAAGLYQRGVPWVCVPTTLVAQVDAGLGGKTGANLRAGKNLVGMFHQPRLLLCDPQMLSTLPARERWSGLAEVVKCALLAKDDLLDRCEQHLEQAANGDGAALALLVEPSLRLKAGIVAADEREGAGRAFLNLGHTVGHALEAATQYTRFTHGEAVAIGLRSALALSKARGMLDAPSYARAFRLVERLRVEAPRSLEPGERSQALAALAHDKKSKGGRVRFVLLRGLGQPELVEVEPAECALALDAALAP